MSIAPLQITAFRDAIAKHGEAFRDTLPDAAIVDGLIAAAPFELGDTIAELEAENERLLSAMQVVAQAFRDRDEDGLTMSLRSPCEVVKKGVR